MLREIEDELARLEASGLRRGLRLVEGAQGPRAVVDGREALIMCSNDYLGLAGNPLVRQAAADAALRWGAGSGASRLVSGTREAHALLEDRLARFKGAEAALLFNSGYNANMGVIPALADRSSEIFSDRLNHASIADACVLSRARVRRYPNRDIDSLERLLKASRARRKLIVTDSVFSMDGTLAPLPGIVGLLDSYGAVLYLDDAHATGVLGGSGRGSLEHFGLSHPSIVQMGTLGKALGSFGAFVCGSRSLVELLVSKARSFIYTTALPPSACAAAQKALDLIEQEPALLERLWSNTHRLKGSLAAFDLDLMGSATPIVPIKAGGAARAMRISAALLERGIFIQGIRPPTVPEGSSRLRAAVSAAHGAEDIDRAAAAIKEAFDACR